MKIKPLKFQTAGVNFLVRNKLALLADEMGLGKTPQLIWAAQKIKAQKILVVCPAVAKYNWEKEFLKFGNIKSSVLFTDWPGQKLKFNAQICSYEYAKRHTHLLKRTKWDLLITDEAHYLKEPTSGRSKAILGNRGLIHHAERSWFATGTPAPNHAGELWVFLYTFGLTKLSYDGFIARYCISHRDGNHYARISITGTNTKMSHELKDIFKGQYIRRLAIDELDLPPLVHNDYIIKGDDDSNLLKRFPELKEKIQGEFVNMQEKLDFTMRLSDDKMLQAMSLMSQSIMSLRRYHGLKKVLPVADIINQELERGEYKKIILFGIHKDVLTYFKKSIDQKYKPLLITGDTSAFERQQIIDRFQEDDSVRVIAGNIQAMGTAITLTAANQVGFIEQDWVPGNNAQAAKRAHRIGQRLPVFVRHFAIAGSLDAKITAALTRKIKEISTFIK